MGFLYRDNPHSAFGNPTVTGKGIDKCLRIAVNQRNRCFETDHDSVAFFELMGTSGN
jgi:hypothetical protein